MKLLCHIKGFNSYLTKSPSLVPLTVTIEPCNVLTILLLSFYSVASTAKRAVLIWFSILVFGNSVTLLSAIGTLLVVIGVFLYHRARHKESAERLRLLAEKEMRELNI